MSNGITNHVTVKVVSQLQKLQYEGVRQKKEASVSKINALLGVKTPQNDNDARGMNDIQTSRSRVLCELSLTAESSDMSSASSISAASVALATEDTVAMFYSYGDHASAARNRFFQKVEEGKSALISKYGENKAIPKSEIASLAKELRLYACTIWRHQIVVTRTQDTPFEGSRMTRNGRYTSTVKSKTIYTMSPLSDDQIESLIKCLSGELKADSRGIVAQRTTENGYVALWRNPETGKIVMTEDTSQFI